MSLLGKILIVFNLLAAGAFAYFAMQDYYGDPAKGNGRQAIAAAGLRHQLVLTGLPLGGVKNPTDGLPPDVDAMPTAADADVPFRMEGPGGAPVEWVSPKLLGAYFQGVGASSDPLFVNTAVPNQLAEVARVKAKIEETLSAAGGPPAKVALLRGWLLYQIETLPERAKVLELADAETVDRESGQPRAKTADEVQRDADELQRRLLARVDGVLNPPKSLDASLTALPTDEEFAGADTDEKRLQLIAERRAKLDESRATALDEDERRRKVAHLLVHLSLEAGWQKRVLAVVGVRGYVKAVLAQARRFSEMAEQVSQELIDDQRAFFAQVDGRPETSDSPEHRGLLAEARDRTLVANRMAAIKAKMVNQAGKDADLVAQRKTHLDELAAQLAKIKTQVDGMLARQSAIESSLFEVQREVAITLDEVYKFEADLRALEQKLAGGGK
jgi:hypothetical protein